MKKVQNATEQDTALNELYRRYNNRETTYDPSPQYAEQRTREINARANSSRTYRISGSTVDELKKHKKNASDSGFVTDGDFARYYKTTREYTPDANVELETTILLQKAKKTGVPRKKATTVSAQGRRENIRKQLRAEAARNNPTMLTEKYEASVRGSAPKPNNKISSEKIQRVAKEAAKTWIPINERHEEKVIAGTKTKLPVGIIFAIIVITISLLLIVGSAVLLASARNEQNELKDAIEKIDFQILEAETELNKKNEKLDIETYAKEVLGMINQEHVSAGYIESNKTDGVIKHQNNDASLTSLIKWIFQNLR